MIKIGKKTVLYTTTILAADNESVLVKTTSDPSLQFSIVFVPDLDTSGNASFAWAIEQGILSLKCYGWRNPIGTHLTEPVKIGSIGKSSLLFNIAHYFVGVQHLAHLFIFIGDENE